MALRECRVTFRDVRDIDHSVTVHAETTMDAAALGLKRIREQHFVMEDLADPVTVELVTSTQHKVSLKKVMEWMAHAGGTGDRVRVAGGTHSLRGTGMNSFGNGVQSSVEREAGRFHLALGETSTRGGDAGRQIHLVRAHCGSGIGVRCDHLDAAALLAKGLHLTFQVRARESAQTLELACR